MDKPARVDPEGAYLNASMLHPGHEGRDVSAHQKELVTVVPVGRVGRDLGRREPEDEPTMTDIDVRELQRVTQERAASLRIGTVDNRMRASDRYGSAKLLPVPLDV